MNHSILQESQCGRGGSSDTTGPTYHSSIDSTTNSASQSVYTPSHTTTETSRTQSVHLKSSQSNLNLRNYQHNKFECFLFHPKIYNLTSIYIIHQMMFINYLFTSNYSHLLHEQF